MGHVKPGLGEPIVSRRRFLGTGARVGVASAMAGTTLGRIVPRPARAAGVTLTYMGLQSVNFPHAADQMLAAFERIHPGVKTQFLDVSGFAGGNEYQNLVTALDAGDGGIDVFDSDVIWQTQLARAGWALPLDKVFPPSARRDYAPAMIWADTIGPHIYGIPWMLDTGHLYYRKDILDANGFKPAATWQEMHDQGVILARKYPTMVPFVASYQQGQQLICNFLECAWSNGGDVLDPKTGSVVIYSPQNLQALELMISLIVDRVVQLGIVSMDLDTGRQIFTNGNAIYHRNWNYAYVDSQQNPKLVGKVGVTAPPHFPGHSSASCAGGWQYGVNAYSNHVDEAVELALFMGSARMQVFKTLHSDFSPAYLPANTDPRVVRQYPYYPMLAEQARIARARPKVSNWTTLSTVAEAELAKALTRAKSPQQALKDAQGKMETVMAGA
jgi:multiple sugar transport system substrate-binding protein